MEESIPRWQQDVVPDWRRVMREPPLRALWWRGIPPKLRGQLWEKAVGNPLQIGKGHSFERLIYSLKADRPVGFRCVQNMPSARPKSYCKRHISTRVTRQDGGRHGFYPTCTTSVPSRNGCHATRLERFDDSVDRGQIR